MSGVPGFAPQWPAPPQVRAWMTERGSAARYGTLNLALHVAENPAAVTANKTLVVIFLRGGADGLNLVVPHGESHYYDLRKGIAVPKPGQAGGAIDLDGRFGLNPRMSALKPLFDERTAIAAHAVGYDRNTRSHLRNRTRGRRAWWATPSPATGG